MPKADGEKLADRCDALAKAGKGDDAVALARSELGNADPEIAGHAHNWLAWHFLSHGAALEPGREHAAQAVRLLPEWGTALLNLARLEELVGKKDEAYAHYRAAMLRQPYNLKLATDHAIALFLERAASDLGAAIVQVPADKDFPIWVLVAPSGAHLLVVRQGAYSFLVNTPNGQPLSDDPASAAKAVAKSASSDKVTLTEAVVAVQKLIRERFSHETLVRIPGSGNEFVELHAKSEAAYVQFSRVNLDRARDKLPELLEEKARDVEQQLAAFAELPKRSAEMKAFIQALSALLEKSVRTPDGSHWRAEIPAGDRAVRFALYWGPGYEHEVAELSIWDGGPSLRIGRDFIPLHTITPEQARDRIADRLTKVTLDRLVPGARYRVIQPFAGRKVGEVITFEERLDLDNHWIVYKYTGEDGASFEAGETPTEGLLEPA